MFDPAALDEICFKSQSEVEAFCRWYLRTTVTDVDSEFESEEERKNFFYSRELHLKTNLDDLSGITFGSAQKTSYKEKKAIFFRIVKDAYREKPLSAEGSFHASTRFNYKTIPEMSNRVVYFSQTMPCCYSEVFHLDIQKRNYAKLLGRNKDEETAEFKLPPYWIFEYEVPLENILVLTAESTFKALGIPRSVVTNEWFDQNIKFEIPSASQILGTLARKRGYNGILYVSSRTQSKSNLVVFESNTGALSFSEVSRYELDHAKFE